MYNMHSASYGTHRLISARRGVNALCNACRDALRGVPFVCLDPQYLESVEERVFVEGPQQRLLDVASIKVFWCYVSGVRQSTITNPNGSQLLTLDARF